MLKIALLDLNHNTLGIHTNTVPLGVCLIAKYLHKTIPDRLEIKLFKLVEKALKTFDYWKPDILGISQYSWNSELNLFISRYIKQQNPDCFIVSGGPNLDLPEKSRIKYLKQHTYIDACVSYDGEIPFTTIVKRLINGESNIDVRKNPSPGTYSLDPETLNLKVSNAKNPRLTTLDEFGSIYAEGLCNEFLDDGFHPFVQTHRGCPFSCTFCHTGDHYYSKMIFQSPDCFEQDMDFLGFRNKNKPNVVLYIANTNMSLFKEDFEIAKIIRKTQNKYGWPKLININSGKNPDNLLEMQKIINFQPAIALQTLTPEVLKNVKRINIPFPDFVNFQNKVSKVTGNPTATELILCLPGETKKSFMQTLEKVMNSGIENIAIFTLMKLKGTPLSTDDSVKKNGYITKYRIVPRQFSIVHGNKIFDTEAVIVASNTMSFEDYLELRGLSFIITVFYSSAEILPFKKFMREQKKDLAKWIFSIQSQIKNYETIYNIYQLFLIETEKELFDSKKELNDFYNIEKNYKNLCLGKIGDNLLRKYKCIVLSDHYNQFLEMVFIEGSKLFDNNAYLINKMLDNLKTFLSTRDMKKYISKDQFFDETRHFHLSYDIQAWLNSSESLDNFQKEMDYTVYLTDETKKHFIDIKKMNHNFELSLQIIYRDGTIMDFWPIWEKNEEQNEK